jgi:hypothetical protein
MDVHQIRAATALIAAETSWIRFALTARRLRMALKHAHWRTQPRVPAGNRDGGQWTGGGGGSGPSGYRPFNVNYRQSRTGRIARYPNARPDQEARLGVAAGRAQQETARVRRLDPNWRPRTIEGEIAHLESVARQAQARYRELTRGAVPGFNPQWSVNRLTKELYRNGYRLKGPARSNGWIYENAKTGEQVRIMAAPIRRYRTDPDMKHLFQYYYRYKPRRDTSEREHTPIPNIE